MGAGRVRTGTGLSGQTRPRAAVETEVEAAAARPLRTSSGMSASLGRGPGSGSWRHEAQHILGVCGCQGGFCSLTLKSPVSFLPSPSLFPLCAGARSHREPYTTGLVLSKPGVCWKERHCGPDSLGRQGGLPGGGISREHWGSRGGTMGSDLQF